MFILLLYILRKKIIIYYLLISEDKIEHFYVVKSLFENFEDGFYANEWKIAESTNFRR